ncbi:hypothetical protein GGI21_004150, partial [Coemansia aciculifera]
MATILSSGRALNANHTHSQIRPLTDSNTTGTADLGSITDNLEKTTYPIIADPLTK